MKQPKLIRLSQKSRQPPSKSIEDQMQVDRVAPRPAESTPGLGIGPSTLPPSSPSTSRSLESNGAHTISSREVHLTASFRDSEHRASPNLRVQSIFGTRKRNRTNSLDDTANKRATSKHKLNWKTTAYSTTKLAINLVRESSDVFPLLKAVAGGLSAILQHCDVRTTHPVTHHP